MTPPTLTRVALETIENYRLAASQTVVAARVGGRRLVRVVDTAFETTVVPRTARLAPKAGRTLDDMRGNVAGILVKGIDEVADRTEKAIALGSTVAAEQFAKVADFAAGIDNALIASGLQTAARLSLPGAQAALAVSGKVVEGANALLDATGGAPARKPARKAAVRKPAVRKAAVRGARGAAKVVKVAPTRKSAKAAKPVAAKAPRAARTARPATAA